MANFHRFEWLLRHSLATFASDQSAVRNFATEMSELDRSEQPAVFKGRSGEELLGFLERAHSALLARIGAEARFTTDEVNITGKDLFDEVSGTAIELKSGPSMTDSGNGLRTVAWAMGDPAPDELNSILGASKFVRREIALSQSLSDEEKSASIGASKIHTMDLLYDYFNARLNAGEIAKPRLSHFCKSVAIGITKQKEIVSTFESPDFTVPILMWCDWDMGLVEYEKAFLPDEPLRIEKVERTPTRTQVVFVGEESRRIAKLYPNYKNSFKVKATGETIPASNWVETSCFHVWITVPIS